MSYQKLHKRKQRPITLGQSKGGNCNVRKDEETYEEETHEERQEEILMPRKGLYANIHAKRKRGAKMRKKGEKGAPTEEAFRKAKRTARKK